MLLEEIVKVIEEVQDKGNCRETNEVSKETRLRNQNENMEEEAILLELCYVLEKIIYSCAIDCEWIKEKCEKLDMIYEKIDRDLRGTGIQMQDRIDEMEEESTLKEKCQDGERIRCKQEISTMKGKIEKMKIEVQHKI